MDHLEHLKAEMERQDKVRKMELALKDIKIIELDIKKGKLDIEINNAKIKTMEIQNKILRNEINSLPPNKKKYTACTPSQSDGDL